MYSCASAPGNRPQPSYNVSVPFGVRAIAVRHVAYGTAAAVAVEGVSSNGTSQAIALDIEPRGSDGVVIVLARCFMVSF